MPTCQDCGNQIDAEQEFCGECGADLTNKTDTDNESFIDIYGAKPLLPFAEARYKNSYNFAKLVSKMPIVRTVLSFFVKIVFFSISISTKIFSIITLGSNLSKRYSAEVEYAKDCYSAGMNGDDRPPSPP